MLIHFLLLSAAAAIGIITAWEDFRYGKIRNIWIAAGFVWGAAVLSAFVFGEIFWKTGGMPWQYAGKVLINSIFSVSVGFIFWKMNVWSAGDAKLFALFSFLIPLEFYGKGYLPVFPSFALLINIFFVIFAYLFLEMAAFFARRFFLKFFFRPKGDSGSPKYFFEKMRRIFSRISGSMAGKTSIFGLLKGFLGGLFEFYEKSAAEKSAKTMPFAFWILAGAVLTVLIKMPVINFLKI